jgi:GNAT superfamily N-acetyltransferase
MKLEGIKIKNRNLITRLTPSVSEFPLIIFARTSDDQDLVYFDDTLPSALCNKLNASNLQFSNAKSAIEILQSFGINATLEQFKTYTFPDNFAVAKIDNVSCLSHDDPKVVAFGFSGLADKVYAIEQEGMILSACVSSRQNSKCAEAWVFTHSEYRRKGLAQQVVMAWANSLLREGLIPFYSHKIENTTSANLANKLNLVHVFNETVIAKVS